MFDKRYTIVKYDGSSWMNQDLLSIISSFGYNFTSEFGVNFDRICTSSFSYKNYYRVSGTNESTLRTFVKCKYLIFNEKGKLLDPNMVFSTYQSLYKNKNSVNHISGNVRERKKEKWSFFKRNKTYYRLLKSAYTVIEDEPVIRKKSLSVLDTNLFFDPLRRPTSFSKSWKEQSKRKKQYK